ncbi:hypothetical protein [Cloacibacillus evryensis]|uniref:hypothetical protein n=1 Tax=Cloacibacillus evryensis TaxID=508460 RepID=UPI002B211C85|nr:hypothetical protein [Cloacibacillus evryensis]MEA5034242.1 hypothetical protein [Cloacibacillus evryensis]
MALKSNKHANAEEVLYKSFLGGINLSVPAEYVATDEMQQAKNFEYDPRTGALKLRAGLVLMGTLEYNITGLAPIAGTSALLARCENGKVYKLQEYTIAGPYATVIEGSGTLSYTLWGDQNELILCAGAGLYIYKASDDTLTKLPNAPARNDFCFARDGRVVSVDTSTDTLKFSGVGDPDNWIMASTNDHQWTAADGVFIDVGYKDGCNMSACAPLTDNLIVFKRPDGQPGQGKIYRLTGSYPDWAVVDYSSGSSAWNHRSCATTTNDLLFITSEGVASLGAVSDYGDFKVSWAGAKVNPQLSKELSESCKLWKMPGAAQVWVSAKPSARVYVYSYGVGEKGAWTTFEFPGYIADACECDGDRYIAIGKQIFKMDEAFGTDNGNAFNGHLKMQAIRRRGMIVLKYVYVAYNSMVASTASLFINGQTVDLPLGGQLYGSAYQDDDIAALDNDPLLASVSATVRRRVNIRCWDATAEIDVQNGPFGLTSVGLEVAEV